MKMGWCTPGSSRAQHAACRVARAGTGVNEGRLLVCECPGHDAHGAPCYLGADVAAALDELI
jgi:hypothetical protein